MDMAKQEMVDHLMEAIMSLETTEECRKFFSDICTDDELNKISRRVDIAKRIVRGDTYRKILEDTNASNITISRLKGVMEREGSVLADVVKRF